MDFTKKAIFSLNSELHLIISVWEAGMFHVDIKLFESQVVETLEADKFYFRFNFEDQFR